MNALQEKLIELLGNFHDFCQVKGLTYYLADGAALAAERGEPLPKNLNKIAVMMPSDDYAALEQMDPTDLPGDCFVESIGTNPLFPSVSMRYGSTQTTLIYFRTQLGTQNPGVALSVNRLVPCTKKLKGVCLNKHRAAGARRTVSENGFFYVSTDEDTIITQGQRNRAYLADSLVEGEEATHLYVQMARSRPLVLDAEIFATRKIVEWQGRRFWLAGDEESYLKAVFGTKWRTVERVYKPLGLGVFLDVSTPFSQYQDLIESLSEVFARYEEGALVVEEARDARDDVKERIDAEKKYYLRTVYRISDSDALLPRKSELLKFHANGDSEALSEALKGAKAHALAMLRADLPFAFDRDLYPLVANALEHDGKVDEANRLRQGQDQAFAYLTEVESLEF